MSKANQPKRPFGQRTSAGLLVLAVLFSSGLVLFGSPKPARAQWVVSDVTLISAETSKMIKQTLKDVLIEGVITAVVNGVNHFATQMAHQLALAIVSECPGQKPCWSTASWGDAVANAGKGALGEAIGTLSEVGGLKELGLDLCNPPSLDFTLQLQLGLLEIEKPGEAKCDFDNIVNNWEDAVSSLSWSELKDKQWVAMTQPGSSPIGVAFETQSRTLNKIAEEAANKAQERLAESAAGGGFNAVKDMVSGRVQAPASFVKQKFDNIEEAQKDPKKYNEALTTGAIAKGTVLSIVTNTAQTFGRTLLSAAWNKMVKGLLSPEQAAQADPEIVLSATGIVKPTQEQISSSLEAQYSSPPIQEIGSYDPLTEFATCPQGNRGPLNCVLDAQFSNAIRVAAAGLPITVRQAIDNGMLHGDWPLIGSHDTERDGQDFCYTVGYCQSNLEKLRAARIIPIGWEIAASQSGEGSDAIKLKDVVDAYNDCNEDGKADANHKWCHLIDPDWVLKQPIGQCRALAYSEHLESSEGPNRLQMCVDPVTCLRENDFGECIGGWGYCTRERNVWRFNADSCPSQFSSCRQLNPIGGGSSLTLLTNTIDYGTCNSDNVGCALYSARRHNVTCNMPGNAVCGLDTGCLCQQPDTCRVDQGARYCLTPSGSSCDLSKNGVTVKSLSCSSSSCECALPLTCRVPKGASVCNVADGDSNSKADDWLMTPARFYNAKAQSCAVNDAGCTELIKLDPGQSLNLVKNSSFSQTEDGDADGIFDHPTFWTPFGSAPVGSKGSLADGGLVLGPSLGSAAGAATGTCNYSAPVAVSNQADCTDSGYFWNGTACFQSVCSAENGCRCDVSGYGCRVPYGEGSCTYTTRVVQAGLPFRQDRPYTVSAQFTATTASQTGNIRLFFVNAIDDAVALNPSLITTQAGTNSTCTVSSFGSVTTLEVQATLPTADVPATASCSFTVSQPVGSQPLQQADLELWASSTNVVANWVQFEEGGGTSYHEGYGGALTASYLKAAPDYLGCTGETGDPDICKSYAPGCRPTEVGCRRYSPTNGDPAVPGIVSANDYCPAECVGYDMYKQLASAFEDADEFPIYMIPSTAISCSAEDVGCSEFTDVETEEVSHYSELRICEQPGVNSDTGTFYTWEGSDTTGYQLQTWRLKTTSTTTFDHNGSSDICAEFVDTNNDGIADTCNSSLNTGVAPCTQLLAGFPDQCDVGDTAGVCSAAEAAVDLDCREFYDEDGNRHFRYQSQTIAVTGECRRLRITQSTEGSCERTNGEWDPVQLTCVYNALPSDSAVCNSAFSGCRAYKGNTAADTRQVFLDDFDSGLGDWTGGTASAEAVTAGGKSLKLSGTAVALRTIEAEALAQGRLYTIQFWAKGTGELAVAFVPGKDLEAAPGFELTADWREFTAGPIDTSDLPPAWGETVLNLQVAKSGIGDAYIDNFILKEVRDEFTIVRDSWVIPTSCDQTWEGAPAPYEMLGCRQYTDDLSATAYLRSFTSLCRDQSVGCNAYSRTEQNEDIWPQTYNAVCSLPGGQECSSTMTTGTSCRCNYSLRHPLASNLEPVVLLDVCRVPFGSTSCRFNLEGLDRSFNLAANPDSIVVPGDSRVFIVANSQSACQSSAAGCTAYGQPTLKYEDTCSLADSCDPSGLSPAENAGKYCLCTDPQTGGVCRVAESAKSCTFPTQDPVVDKWTTVAFKNDPATYAQASCLEDEVGCQGYTSSDGTQYFRSPGSKVCEYKETASYQGQTVSGWFRKSASGQAFPCYPELLRNGDEYGIYRNADASCTLDEACADANGCACADNTGTNVCVVPQGFQSCGFQGWAGLCDAKYDRCEEIIDPSSTSPLVEAGTPYTYINDPVKLDTATCAGNVNIKEGCALFDLVSDKRTLYSSAASYLRSIDQGGGTPITVSAVNCDVRDRSSYCAARCMKYKEGSFCRDNPDDSCTQDSDCESGDKCNGTEVYGIGCLDDAGCQNTGGICVYDEREYQVGGLGTPGQEPAGAAPHSDSRGKFFTRNDSNRIVKVRPDRECGEWLSCLEQDVNWDDNTNSYRLICTDFRACRENQESGKVFQCAEPVENRPIEQLGLDTYSGRDVTWSGMDYAGFSIYESYPPELLSPVSIKRGLCRVTGTNPPEAVARESGNSSVAFTSGKPDTQKYCVTSAGNVTTTTCDDDGDCGSNFCGSPFCYTNGDCGSVEGVLYCDRQLQGVCVVPNSTEEPQPCTCSSSSGSQVQCNNGYCSCNDLTTTRYGVIIDRLRCGGEVGGTPCQDNGDCAGATECLAAPCESNSQCPADATGETGSCINNHCYFNLTGGRMDAGDRSQAPRCRAYPEADAPFPASVLVNGDQGYDQYLSTPKEVVPLYKGANVCVAGNDCECSYTRAGYGPGASYTRFYSYNDIENADVITKQLRNTTGDLAYCIGGGQNGKVCRAPSSPSSPTNTETSYDDCQNAGGQCAAATKKVRAYGWPGFCIDEDMSMVVNNDRSIHGCFLWLPIDQLSGMPNRLNQFRQAGWNPPAGVNQVTYCQDWDNANNQIVMDAATVRANARGAEKGNVFSWGATNQVQMETRKWYCSIGGIFGAIFSLGIYAGVAELMDEIYPERPTNPAPGCTDLDFEALFPSPVNTDPAPSCAPNRPGDWETQCSQTVQDNIADWGEQCIPDTDSSGSGFASLIGADLTQAEVGNDTGFLFVRVPTSAPDIHRDQLAGVRIRVRNALLYLSRDLTPGSEGDFMNYFKFRNDNIQPPEDPLDFPGEQGTFDGVSNIYPIPGMHDTGHPKCSDGTSSGEEPCSEVFNYTDGSRILLESYCDQRRGSSGMSFFAAKATFDGNNLLTGVMIAYCNKDVSCSQEEPINEVVFRMRDNCTQLTNVYDTGKDFFEGAPYADRLYKLEQPLAGAPGGYPAYEDTTSRDGLTGDQRKMAPLGQAAPAGILGIGSDLGQTTLDTADREMPRHHPVPVFSSETGSPYTHLSQKCTYGSAGNCAQFEVDWTGDNPHVAGVPMGTSEDAGWNRIKEIFAYSWLSYGWQRSGARDGYVSRNTGTGLNSLYRDDRLAPGVTLSYHQPQVRSVLSPCTGNVCPEGPTGLTASANGDDVYNNDLNLAGGSAKVTLKFFAWAHSDRMPIRRVLVDYYGGSQRVGGRLLSASKYTDGYFKNHRGRYDDGGGGVPQQVCGNASSWTEQGISQPPYFGATVQACDDNYFEFTKTYTCTSEMVAELPSCGGGEFPCQQGGRCGFRPRVQLLDNWGSCNGTCPEGAANDACINRSYVTYEESAATNWRFNDQNECTIIEGDDPFVAIDTYNGWRDNRPTPTPVIEPWTSFGGDTPKTIWLAP
jgi:hypothetical protein